MSYKAQDVAWVELSKIAFTDRDVPQKAYPSDSGSAHMW